MEKININYTDIEKSLFLHVSQMMQWDCRRLEELPKDLRKSLRTRIEKISDGFTSERADELDLYLEEPLDVAAYAMYFHASSLHRMLQVLQQMPAALVELPTQLSVLDVGAGTGAASQAFLLFLQQMRKKRLLKVQLFDQSQAAMEFAKAHLTRVSLAPIGVKTKVVDMASIEPVQESFDVYLFSNVINELDDIALEKILKGMKQNSWVVMVEPALKESSLKLMQMKTRMVELGLNIWAPCTHNLACPMLTTAEDWCHFKTPWQMGPFRKSMDQALGHRSEVLKYAYLTSGQQKVKEKRKRVLSETLKSKIKKVSCLHVCDQKHIGHYYFDKKHPELRRTQRGDLLTINKVSPYPQAKRYYPNAQAYWIAE